jgi:hypothetical protein
MRQLLRRRFRMDMVRGCVGRKTGLADDVEWLHLFSTLS